MVPTSGWISAQVSLEPLVEYLLKALWGTLTDSYPEPSTFQSSEMCRLHVPLDFLAAANAPPANIKVTKRDKTRITVSLLIIFYSFQAIKIT
jgi:hypothetical protein